MQLYGVKEAEAGLAFGQLHSTHICEHKFPKCSPSLGDAILYLQPPKLLAQSTRPSMRMESICPAACFRQTRSARRGKHGAARLTRLCWPTLETRPRPARWGPTNACDRRRWRVEGACCWPTGGPLGAELGELIPPYAIRHGTFPLRSRLGATNCGEGVPTRADLPGCAATNDCMTCHQHTSRQPMACKRQTPPGVANSHASAQLARGHARGPR